MHLVTLQFVFLIKYLIQMLVMVEVNVFTLKIMKFYLLEAVENIIIYYDAIIDHAYDHVTTQTFKKDQY